MGVLEHEEINFDLEDILLQDTETAAEDDRHATFEAFANFDDEELV